MTTIEPGIETCSDHRHWRGTVRMDGKKAWYGVKRPTMAAALRDAERHAMLLAEAPPDALSIQGHEQESGHQDALV